MNSLGSCLMVGQALKFKHTHRWAHVRAHAHTHEARSQNLLTDMPVKGKLSCLRSYKNPWEGQTSGILHLAWEEMDKGPGATHSWLKLEAVISWWNTNHLRKKKKPKSWPLSPKKFIVYLSCLNITLCPISQPSSFWVRTLPNFEGWYLCLFLSSSLFLFYWICPQGLEHCLVLTAAKKYWVGQKVWSGFPVPFNGKTQENILANPVFIE